MSTAPDKRLSIADVARLIYSTDAPSDEQLLRVYRRMKAGALRVCDEQTAPREWTTTEQALADFLASEMLRQRKTPPQSARTRDLVVRSSTRQARDSKQLRWVYHGIWREYFQAVLLRRRMAQYSARFRRAVVAGQAVTLVTIVGVLASLARFTIEPKLAEHVAIERWINERTDRYEIVRWHSAQPAPNGEGVLVEVAYRYAKDSPRTITTQRTLHVAGGSVSEYTTE